MTRTKNDRVNSEQKKLKKQRSLSKVKWYRGYEYKSKEDRFETDPDKCYFVEASKSARFKIYKKVSMKTLRNRVKRELRNNPEEANTYNGAVGEKTYDYKWTID